MNIITYMFCGFVFCCLIFLFNDFTKLLYGNNYVLEMMEVIIICLNFYIATMLLPLESVKSAAGLYYEDRYISLIQAAINVFISIILGLKIGLIGVLLGTFISYILTTVWERPIIIYKEIFKSNSIVYFKKYILQIFIIVFNILLDYLVITKLFTQVTILNFILKGITIFIVYVVTNIIIFIKSNELQYILKTIKDKFFNKNKVNG